MYVEARLITLILYDTKSLKDKRAIRQSLFKKIQNKYNVSISEIDHLEDVKYLSIGISGVSNNLKFLNESLESVILFIEESVNGDIIDIEKY